MQTIEYITQPQGEVLQEFADCRASRSFIMGPLGSGKTIQAINKIFDIACEQEPIVSKANRYYGKRLTRGVVIRNTYSELMSTTIKDWRECHDDLGEFKFGSKEPPNQLMQFRLPDGTEVRAEIYFIAFDRPEHIKKARGLQLTWAWLNEVKELPKAVIDMLDMRIGRYPSAKEGMTPTWAGLLGDTNAPDVDHWYYEFAEKLHPEGWKFHRQPGAVFKTDSGWQLNQHAENLKNLPDNYYSRGLQGKEEDWIKVNLANEYGFVADGKPVHPRYIDSVHCKDMPFAPSTKTPIILGFDFGRTPACAMLQKVEYGRWVCFDEFCATDMSAVTFAPELKKYIDNLYGEEHTFIGWGDPSGGKGGEANDDTAHKMIRAGGLPCIGTPTNKPTLRRAALEKPMTELAMDGKPRFVILPKCHMIRKGLQGAFCYRRIQVSGEKYTDIPDKNEWSHPVEALEYGLQGEGEGRSAVTVAKRRPVFRGPQPIKAMGVGACR